MKRLLVLVGVFLTLTAASLCVALTVLQVAVHNETNGASLKVWDEGRRRVSLTASNSPGGVSIHVTQDGVNGGGGRAGYVSRTDDIRTWLGGNVRYYRIRGYDPGTPADQPDQETRAWIVNYVLLRTILLVLAGVPLLFRAVRRQFARLGRTVVTGVRSLLSLPRRPRGFDVLPRQ